MMCFRRCDVSVSVDILFVCRVRVQLEESESLLLFFSSFASTQNITAIHLFTTDLLILLYFPISAATIKMH